MSRTLRTLGVFLVALALVLPPAAAAPRRTPDGDASSGWTLTGSLWRLFTTVWTKAGCILDPNGVSGSTCVTPPETTN